VLPLAEESGYNTVMDKPDFQGRKVFFVYPHSVIREQVVDVLLQAEFETALIHDHQKVYPVLQAFPRSILFLNIEQKLTNTTWDNIVDEIQAGRSEHGASLGVVVYNPNPEMAQHYLMDKGLECGFIQLKLGTVQTCQILLKTLEANEARGRRQFVRVSCPTGRGRVNIRYKGRPIEGDVLDVSSAGMLCNLGGRFFQPGELLEDMQLKLWGIIMAVQCRVAGHREVPGEGTHTVLTFESLTRESKVKLHSFIRKVLQAEVDAL